MYLNVTIIIENPVQFQGSLLKSQVRLEELLISTLARPFGWFYVY